MTQSLDATGNLDEGSNAGGALMRIVCLSPFAEEVVLGLAGGIDVEVVLVPAGTDGQDLRDAVAEADVVIGDAWHRYHLDRDVLSAMRRCRLVQQPSVGFDGIDCEAAAQLGIPVANLAGYNRDSVADWAIMAMLNLIRHGSWGDRRLRAGDWPPEQMLGHELGGMTVGIIGVGNTGGAVANRLRAFGSRVLYHDVIPISVPGADACSLEDLLARADIVTIHVPLDESTRGLIDEAALQTMKAGAFLVNSSRGPVVDEDALVVALRAGAISAAALDVFAVEPLAADSELRQLENVFITPHTAAYTRDANDRALEIVGANVRRVLAGQPPFNVVNK